MVADAAVLCVINHFHRDELTAVGQDIQIGVHGLVLVEDFGDYFALPAPSGDFEDGNVQVTCGGCQCVFAAIFIRHREHSHYFVAAVVGKSLEDFRGEDTLTDDRDF